MVGRDVQFPATRGLGDLFLAGIWRVFGEKSTFLTSPRFDRAIQ
jgi:hypothetical protein